MDVIFERATERDFTLRIWSLATVREAKEALKSHQSIPVSKQMMEFNGEYMADERLLDYYRLVPGSRVRLHEKMVVIIEPNLGAEFMLEISSFTTTSQIKEMIQEKKGARFFCKERQRLIFGHLHLGDQWRMSSYGVRDGSRLRLSFKGGRVKCEHDP